MTERQRQRHRVLGVLLHRWHRRIGVAACVFAVWLAASGWALNHTQALGLKDIGLRASWLTRWYGLSAIDPAQGYRTGDHWLAGNEESSSLDGHVIAPALAQPVGLSELGPLLFAADANGIALLGQSGEAVDRLAARDAGLESIARIGRADSQVVVADEGGHMSASRDGVSWAPFEGTPSWSVREALPPPARAAAREALAPAIPLERVLLDAHSGRLIGAWGPWLVDAAGLLLAVLAVTGLWMVLRRRSHPSRPQHRGHI
jgi:hypothetical protein